MIDRLISNQNLLSIDDRIQYKLFPPFLRQEEALQIALKYQTLNQIWTDYKVDRTKFLSSVDNTLDNEKGDWSMD